MGRPGWMMSSSYLLGVPVGGGQRTALVYTRRPALGDVVVDGTSISSLRQRDGTGSQQGHRDPRVTAQGEAGGDHAAGIRAAGAGAAGADRAAGARGLAERAGRRGTRLRGGHGPDLAAPLHPRRHPRPGRPAPRLGGPEVYGPSVRLALVAAAASVPPDDRPEWAHALIAAELAGTGISASAAGSWLTWNYGRATDGWLSRADDAQFWAQAAAVCDAYLRPPPDTMVICIDEKTGIQAKYRKYPGRLPAPGRPARRGRRVRPQRHRRHRRASSFIVLVEHRPGGGGSSSSSSSWWWSS